MCLKNGGKPIWALFALSVVCFAVILCLSARHPTPLVGFRSPGAAEETTQVPAKTELPDASAYYTETSTLPADETATQPAAGDWEFDTREEETADAQDPTAGTGAAKDRAFFTVALGFLLIGLAAGMLFLLLHPFRRPLISPAAELLLGGVCFYYLQRLLRETVITPWTVLGGILLFAVPELCGKSLFSWAAARFSPRFSLVRRFALRAGKRSEKAVAAVLFFAVGLSAVCFAAALVYLAYSVPAGSFGLLQVLLLASAGLFLYYAVSTAVDFSGALFHLTRQIAAAGAGQTPELRADWFENSERALLAVDRAREAAVSSALRDERFRAELITNVSHDLRTPLTSVLGYAELLKNEPLTPEGTAHLESLCGKAGYLRDMIEELFALTKVSTGQIEQKRETLDLLKLLEQTLGLLDDGIRQKGLLVRRHYETESMPVVSDGAMLHRVLDNLIGNAVKYSPQGARLHLYAAAQEKGVQLRIVNTANYEMDFDVSEITGRFVRGDRARATQGSGLGLAIAKTYTEAVGGTFGVSVDGDQFTAAVWLPTEK